MHKNDMDIGGDGGTDGVVVVVVVAAVVMQMGSESWVIT